MADKLSPKERKLKARVENSLKSFDITLFTGRRRFFSLLPSDPRCVACLAPFEGIGSVLARVVFNKRRSTMNPLMCNECEDLIRRLHYGAEVQMSILFADIRGSTQLAEHMSPTAFKNLIDRFYSETSHILIHSYAMVDKLVGDEVSGYYIPGIAGEDYAQRAVNSAREILKVTGHGIAGDPWAPLGVGIHTGKAYFGAVTSAEDRVDLTALGDAVNTAARLTSQAAAGEIVISGPTAQEAGIDTNGLEKRTLELKGKSEPMDVWVLKLSE
jgi:adenylate cyclase